MIHCVAFLKDIDAHMNVVDGHILISAFSSICFYKCSAIAFNLYILGYIYIYIFFEWNEFEFN